MTSDDTDDRDPGAYYDISLFEEDDEWRAVDPTTQARGDTAMEALHRFAIASFEGGRQERELGMVGDTKVSVIAEGPKAQWAADVLTAKFEPTFDAIRRQVDEWEARDG